MTRNTAVEQIYSVLDAFKAESDRGAVLVACCYLEDKIGEALRDRLVAGTGLDRLFEGGNAPFGTFSARIAGAHALGLVDDEGFRHLEMIRKIRNHFAHELNASFEDPKIADRCNAFEPTDPDSLAALQRNDPKSNRDRFLFAAVALFVLFSNI